MDVEYKIIAKENLSEEERNVFSNLLRKQNKITGDLSLKADRCKEICIAYMNEVPIAIGAIKRKTKSDFNKNKADLPAKEKDFDWELGYIYTDENYTGKGISSRVVEKLLSVNNDISIMASTEIVENPAMVKILKKNGFEQKGKSWKSSIHGNDLGLFLKYE